jgi:uncharacterized protein (DUF1499 family)
LSAPGTRSIRAIFTNAAATTLGDRDPRLQGRTYAIPFQNVWETAHELASRRWRIISTDDQEGVILAEARTAVFRFVDDVEIRITLDENAQTRVDLRSASRRRLAVFGGNARRIVRFLHRLDATLSHNRKQRSAATQPTA